MELNQTKIHVVVEHSDSEDEMFIGTIDTDAKEKVKEWKVDLKINSRKATFKIDMGAQCNVMLLSLYKQVTKEKVQRSTTKLISYSGHKMQTIGKITLLVEYIDKFYPAEFQVTAQEEVMPVLGLPTCLDMALVKRIYAVNSSDDKPFSQAEPQESHDNSSDDKDQKPASEKIMERYADVFQGLGCLDGD